MRPKGSTVARIPGREVAGVQELQEFKNKKQSYPGLAPVPPAASRMVRSKVTFQKVWA